MKKAYLGAIIFLLLVVISAIIGISFTNSTPHQFKEGQCGFCHLNYEYPLHFRGRITALCNYCHGKRSALSHIVDMRPSMQIPEDFHLDENGDMTCDTCHNIHMDKTDPVTGERTYLLRSGLRGREFCNSCHGETINLIQPNRLPVHAEVLDKGHFGYDAEGRSDIDAVSIICISCHEGTTAGDAPVAFKTGHPTGGSHPIGMDYVNVYRENNELKSTRSLSPEIKLFGGKVGCTSCHNPFSLTEHQLSVANEGSKLCLECHLK